MLINVKLRLGWGQEWGWGISTRISLAYARRTYKGADLFNIRQKNNEYQSACHIYGIEIFTSGDHVLKLRGLINEFQVITHSTVTIKIVFSLKWVKHSNGSS